MFKKLLVVGLATLLSCGVAFAGALEDVNLGTTAGPIVDSSSTFNGSFIPTWAGASGGFAIGDVTGDGKNEIGATWGASIHKWIGGKYRTIGVNSWIFDRGGGSGDAPRTGCGSVSQNQRRR